MRKLNSFILVLVACLAAWSNSQAAPNISSRDQTILVGAQAKWSPTPSITVFWQKHAYASSYMIRRKLVTETESSSWKLLASNLDSLTTSYVDNTVKLGVEYEYEVTGTGYAVWGLQQHETEVLKFFAFGYIAAAVQGPEKDIMGDVLLVVDSSLYEPVKPSLDLLSEQLKKEGWRVLPYFIAPRAEQFDKNKVATVKNYIYGLAKDTKNYDLKSVLLIGRVPIPYSGKLNPDAHPDHLGAWPADGYYGVLNSFAWPDASVKDTLAEDNSNWNVPGDGKFDVSDFSNNPVKIAIGRIDFYNMPIFAKSEAQLIQEYVEKNLAYRTGALEYISRGVIDDNFGAFGGGEGFATSGWRNFGALCGPDSVRESDFFETLGTDNYLWSYGCGGGWPQGAGGVGNTNDLATKQVKGVFSFLFGSYFGDWNRKDNNFLRGAIASQPSVLTCAWAGRPQWYVHRMGLGYPIGESELVSQNNSGLYRNNAVWINANTAYTIVWGTQGVHVTLIGDPTLKMYAGNTPAPSSLTVSRIGDGIIKLNWTQESGNENLRYNVYRSSSPEGPYVKINKERIDGLQFIDTTELHGEVYYAVSASRLLTVNSGAIWYSGERLFGHTEGKGVSENTLGSGISVSPNPASDHAEINFTTNESGKVIIEVFDFTGAKIMDFSRDFYDGGNATINWDLTDYSGARIPQGAYLVSYKIGSNRGVAKISVIR